MLWSTAFWKATAERVITTFAEALVAVLIVGNSIAAVDWPDALAVAALAAVVSLLKCVAASGVSPATGPSLGTEVLPRDTAPNPPTR